MGEVISIGKVKTEEDTLILCQICDAEDILSLTYFAYEDGSFKCANCGATYLFNTIANDIA
tara:strand:- start:30 stop:212 length:183 start_codon:yes stop_codon:yes gene_type:complete